jgi:glucosamine--fructose-6-phosphate aminotransferase (isomerizing)
MKEPGGFLRENIRSQPATIEALLGDWAPAQTAAERLSAAARIFVVGTGTSFHGALVGQHLFRSAGRDAWAVPAFEFSQYTPRLRLNDGLVLLSHRGTKRFSRASLDLVAAAGGNWIAITGKGSPLEGAGVLQTVPQETSPVITVSHLGAMLRLAQLAAAASPPPSWLDALPNLPSMVRAAVDTEPTCADIAQSINLDRTLFFVGGGPGWANALEGALKVREAAYVSTVGYQVEEILHGPMVSVDAKDTVVIIAEPGPSLARAQDVAGGLRAIGAQIVAIGSAAPSIPGARWTLQMPALPEVLAPLVNVIPLQWLAYQLSLRTGADADSFRTNEEPYALARERVEL